MPLQVAIIGSGPAGCYAAEKLARDAPDARIDVIDRLPVPYGLVRAGVAPDHQGTKAISRVFQRVLDREGVGFLGNVEVGRDVTLSELRGLYDVVVLATGAGVDRRLGVPGEDLAGVVGSGAFVGWYNGHPDWAEAAPALGNVRSVVVIGNGNVALDVARIVAKVPAELDRSDIDPDVEAALASAPLEEIHIVGRRGAGETSFSPNDLAELGALARAAPVVDPADLPPGEGAEEGVENPAALAILRDFAARPPAGKPVAIRFHFHARAEAALGEGRVEAVRFARAGGGGLTLPAGLVVTCIGYGSAGCCDLAAPGGVFGNSDGRITGGLYVVGWAKRGPSGTIAANRAESHAVAKLILAEAKPAGRAGGTGLRRLLAERGAGPVDGAGWKLIDAAETAGATPGRVRRKLTRLADLLAASTK